MNRYSARDILNFVSALESSNIYELLFNRGIDIFVQPSLFRKDDTRDAIILSTPDGHTGIFLRIDPLQYPKYAAFLLWHELGHYIIDGPNEHTRSFDLTGRLNHDESTVNMFTVFAMVPPENVSRTNVLIKAADSGIPSEVMIDIMFRLSLEVDDELQHYYDEYK